MNPVNVSELIPVLQTAIGPMILISGVGLLLLTMSNRLGRVVDRARSLASLCSDPQEPSRSNKLAQLEILWKRARLIRAAISLLLTSALMAAILIVALFLTALFGLEDAWLIGGLFIVGMLSIIGSMVYFLLDINESLTALRLELIDTVDLELHK